VTETSNTAKKARDGPDNRLQAERLTFESSKEELFGKGEAPEKPKKL